MVCRMRQLGLETVTLLSKSICEKRVAFLRKRIKSGAYRGTKLKYAKYYANWYSWMAKNGGTRSKIKKSTKAPVSAGRAKSGK